MSLKCLILLISVFAYSSALGSVKNITVRGRLVCSKKPQRNVAVELWEYDLFEPDDLLNTTKTDRNGYFEVYGQQDEMNKIEPYVMITHNCDNGRIKKRCRITDRYDVPHEHENAVYDMGIVSLNIAKRRFKHCV